MRHWRTLSRHNSILYRGLVRWADVVESTELNCTPRAVLLRRGASAMYPLRCIFIPQTEKKVKPILQALLVADHVYVDRTTNKKIIAGVFHHLYFKKRDSIVQQDLATGQTQMKIPPGGMQASSPFCYISITDVKGKQPFQLRFVDLAEDKVVFHADFDLDSDNPLSTVEVVFPLPSLPTNKAGTFVLELAWNNESLGSHRIIVDEAPD